MSVRNLDKIFQPKSVAVIGASDNPAKVGFTVIKNLIAGEFQGTIFPVNQRATVIQGLTAYPQVSALPEVPDLAVICTPAMSIPEIINDCGAAGIRGLVILSAGFRESGTSGAALERKIQDVQKKYDGMRIVGPNCLGVMVPAARLNASFAADAPRPGKIALISQSGALCTSLLDWAAQEQIGFSHFISLGNMLDVGFGDLIDYCGADPETQSIILYVESISDVRSFMSASRAVSRNKPIIAYKAGRFAESAKAAASHTGAMVGADDACDAAFQRAGIERVYSIDEMFDCAELLASRRIPSGERLAIITNAGGPGVMATDSLILRQGRLATLSDSTLNLLDEVLPPGWSHGNPIDILGDATPERFARAVELVLADPNVDAGLAILTPQAMTDPTGTADRVAEVVAQSHKPLLASWIGGQRVQSGREQLARAGIPTYSGPEHAVNAFMHLVSRGRNLELLYETPQEVPLTIPTNRDTSNSRIEKLMQCATNVISESDSKSILEDYGIPIVTTSAANTVEEAVEHAKRIGYPVVLKIRSPQISHKTDVEGVALGIQGDDGVRKAFERIVAAARHHRPDAHIEGVTVQRMISAQDGVELIAGVKKDAMIGAVQMVGAGGITAELLGDRALGLPPLNERLARRMIESLRIWPLLHGYRSRPTVDVAALIEVLMRLSYLAADHPEIQELEINPLLVTPRGVTALDARVILDQSVRGQPVRPYSHLAIRPYPEDYVRKTCLAKNTAVTLRPIRPEDEPRWHQMLAACSAASLHARFHYLFKMATHEMATKYCVTDYDRELALVAQIDSTGDFAGVARLAADPDHETAEFAILVRDAWQGVGLGELLTRNCVEIARQWGLRKLTAATTIDNSRMLAIFQQNGFTCEQDKGDGIVFTSKSLVDE